MERERLGKESEADTPVPYMDRATSVAARARPPARGRHAREGISDPSAGRDGTRSSWTSAGVAMNLPGKMPDVLKRYGLALALAGLALYVRSALPLLHGTAIYQLPIAAVVLSAWYGGRGPGFLALVVCATGILYWLIPPVNSFDLHSDYALAFSIFIALCLLLTEFSAGRRRAEQALRAAAAKEEILVRESEERLSALAGSTDEVAFEFDENGKYLNVWTRNEALLFRPRHELIGRTLAEVFDEGWARRHVEKLRRVLANGTTEIWEYRIDFPSERRWFLGRMNPMPSLGGARPTVCCLVRDITQQKRDEASRSAQYGVARALADSDSLAAAAPNVLAAIAENMEWDWGAFWIVDRKRGRLCCEALWHAPNFAAAELDELSRKIALRTGEGGPAGVCETAQPDWVAKVAEDRGSSRKEVAARAGLQSCVALPILDLHSPASSNAGRPPAVAPAFASDTGTVEITGQTAGPPISGEVLGVIELFSLHMRERDEVQLAMFNVLGGQIGQFLKRKRAEAELRQREQELRARQEMLELAQTAAGAMAYDWYTGARESENRWSPEIEALFGLEPGAFDGTYEGWKKLVHPDDWPAVKLAIKRAHESGDVATEYRVIHKDGTVHWLRGKGRMFFDAEGRPERNVGFIYDVTDQRHAEEELRASEKRFRTFFDRASDAFFVLDAKYRVVDINRQACESLGLSREELIGIQPLDFDVGLDAPAIDRVAERARAGEIITFETRHRRKDGTTFPVEIRTGTFTQGGELFYLALARDVSERKQAEERKATLAAIVESSDDAIISKDLNGVITTWNTGAERIFGYAAQEVIGQSVTILVPPDRVDEERGILERIRRGERLHHIETVRRRKDGTLLDISLTVSPIIDESGNAVGASKVARDISERKRAEDALREKEDALEMARTELARVSRLTTLGELTASIAHEVGQPLGAMVASAGACARWIVADPPAMAEARTALDNIVADGKRAREVIARIRALAKRQGPRKDWLDINQEVAEVLALTEHELRSHHIVLRTDLRGTLPRVAGDRVQLQQVLLNLIVNAVEAMSAVHDRPRELAIVSRLDDPDAVLVEVRDSGSGLDPQAAEQVFEAFYTTKTEGIGIGLSISRSIIEAHGGRLWAAPNEPHGAVFRFSLPIAQEAVS
jgi:PAS domain S-box-containing protein